MINLIKILASRHKNVSFMLQACFSVLSHIVKIHLIYSIFEINDHIDRDFLNHLYAVSVVNVP